MASLRGSFSRDATILKGPWSEGRVWGCGGEGPERGVKTIRRSVVAPSIRRACSSRVKSVGLVDRWQRSQGGLWGAHRRERIRDEVAPSMTAEVGGVCPNFSRRTANRNVASADSGYRLFGPDQRKMVRRSGHHACLIFDARSVFKVLPLHRSLLAGWHGPPGSCRTARMSDRRSGRWLATTPAAEYFSIFLPND